jgi:dTDP-4-dehydrorhamnose 3,5-epimerase
MKVTETKLAGLLVIEPKIFQDSRGYFFESYNKRIFSEANLDFDFVQDNESRSEYGVVRGLHYQLEPHAQTKLIRVLSGKILDVCVDIRKDSPTFGEWESIELSSENKKQVLVPTGFAHGFSVLSKEATVFYKCDNLYHTKSERGIIYNDSELGIDWKIAAKNMIISEKDQSHPRLREADINFVT